MEPVVVGMPWLRRIGLFRKAVNYKRANYAGRPYRYGWVAVGLIRR